MAKQKRPPGEPMDLANMRSLGVRGLAVKCLQPACLHAAIVSVDDYPDDMLVRDFAKRMVCAKSPPPFGGVRNRRYSTSTRRHRRLRSDAGDA
jgi:hypothetical protein